MHVKLFTLNTCWFCVDQRTSQLWRSDWYLQRCLLYSALSPACEGMAPKLSCLLTVQINIGLFFFGSIFGRPFVKRFVLCYWTVVLSVLSVCNVGVLWPNFWMDQDETLHGGRPRPWPHWLDGDPALPHPKGHTPIFGPISVVAKRLDGSRCHLVRRQASQGE